RRRSGEGRQGRFGRARCELVRGRYGRQVEVGVGQVVLGPDRGLVLLARSRDALVLAAPDLLVGARLDAERPLLLARLGLGAAVVVLLVQSVFGQRRVGLLATFVDLLRAYGAGLGLLLGVRFLTPGPGGGLRLIVPLPALVGAGRGCLPGVGLLPLALLL